MWKKKQLSKVGDIVTGNTPSTKDSSNYGSDFPFIKPPELKSNLISDAPEMLSIRGAKSARLLPPNTVMVSCIGNLGKVAINKVTVATNQQINSIIPNEDIVPKYLFYQVQSQSFRNQLYALSSATTVTIVNKSNFSKVEIPVPPPSTQHRIVEKIEELFSELDNGIENLKKAQVQLKTYRQAVLKDAFEGKLTKEWRDQQIDLPSPEELLKQIRSERKAYHESELSKWDKVVKQWEKDGKSGKKPKKPRKALSLDLFTHEELLNLDQLPENWVWIKVDKIIGHDQYSIKAGPFGSALKKEIYVEEGYKVYGQEQVIGGDHTIGDYYIDQKKYDELSSCIVEPSDVLISLVGTFGKVLILPEEMTPGVINPRLVKITLNANIYFPKFFKYFFESAYLKSLYSNKTHGATMDVLNLSIIKELPFPLMSKEEQSQIVQEIESRLSVVDQLEQTIKENLLKAQALRQSILKKAFGGELVEE